MIEFITELSISTKARPDRKIMIRLTDLNHENAKETLGKAWEQIAYDVVVGTNVLHQDQNALPLRM